MRLRLGGQKPHEMIYLRLRSGRDVLPYPVLTSIPWISSCGLLKVQSILCKANDLQTEDNQHTGSGLYAGCKFGRHHLKDYKWQKRRGAHMEKFQ